MKEFTYTGHPARVVFGSGTVRQIASEVERLGCKRALVLSTSHQAHEAVALSRLLGHLAVGRFTSAEIHTPVAVTQRAVETADEVKADCLVAIGGGSAIGLGKAITLHRKLPQIAVPTTYAGSEMTPILGQTDNGLKTTIRNTSLLPKAVIYDVNFTLSLPPALSATSGMNAMAHAVEALYAKDGNPVISMLALEAIRALSDSLPAIMKDPSDVEARTKALYGAWLCGIALGTTGMALHHKLCHTLGGSFNLPHSETHTVVLPHAAAFNAPAVGGALDKVAEILGAKQPGDGLYEFARMIGAPVGLKEIGMPEDGLDQAAEIATQNPYWNPRPFTKQQIRSLLDDAYFGRPPSN